MAGIDVPLTRAGFGQTSRHDLWWVQPLVVFLGLSAFIVYATWAAFQGDHYRFGPYLRRSTRRNCLAIPCTLGSALSRRGSQTGSHFLRRF